MCWYRWRSSIGLQLRPRALETNLAAELAQASVRSRGRNELQSSADGLGDAGPACSLCLLQKVRWNLYRDLTRGHPVSFIPYSIPALNMVIPNPRKALARSPCP